jgi:hypothetical protein
MTPKVEGPHQEKILNDIKEYGWSGIGVVPTADDPEPRVPFVYTIGAGKQEFIITGLPPRTGHLLLGEAIEAERDYEPGERYGRIADGYRVAALDVSEVSKLQWMGQAVWYHDGPDFEAIQFVWPDKEHRFPWEHDYDSNEQPLLGLERIKL